MKKTIFLDIDGVLQPGGWQKRFDIDRKALQRTLTETLNADYVRLDEYDVAAVYCDWDKAGVELLKKLLTTYEARIIISSSWRRSKTLEELQHLFRIHDLDKYVVGAIPMPDDERPLRIQQFMDKDHEMGKFVILDDDCWSLRQKFPDNLVCCPNRFTEKEYEQAAQILA